jgi:uncharacterized Zn-binding protein involved in type VI secretion
MEKAARKDDPVGHTMAMAGLIAGAVAGALIGAACVATGGAALVVVAAVAAGASAGAGIGEVLGSLSFIPPMITGAILTGSHNVTFNSRPAARAHDDTDLCAGMPPLFVPPHLTNPIAQGSKIVTINGMPAARRGDKTSCGAVIADGSSNVYIGGPAATTDAIAAEVPAWLNDAILVVGLAAAVVLAGPLVALAGFAGGYLGGQGGAWLGGKLFGEGSDGQKLMALGGAFLGGMLAGGGVKALTDEPVAAVESDAPPYAKNGEWNAPRNWEYQAKQTGRLEPGAVNRTPELTAAMKEANSRTAPAAPDGWPSISDDTAKTFGADPTPVKYAPGTKLYRVIGSDRSSDGSFWTTDPPPATEAEWRGDSAVKDSWNGDGGYVEHTVGPDGLRAWSGPIAPQDAAVDGYVLPGNGQQTWVPPGTLKPDGPPQPTPWNLPGEN